MATDTVPQHPPAMKVGGRRLSVSSRPKPHPPPATTTPPVDDPADYPRPAAPVDEALVVEEEAPPKKEKKKGNGADEHERRLQESLYKKAGQNRPSRESHAAKNLNAVGGGGRIAQPAGRGL